MGNFDKQVFLNCPFDVEYEELLKPLFFTVISCGFKPRIASERLDSGEVRLDKIKNLILECRFGIHDLSRCKSKDKDEYSRFNMPFELAYDLAARDFHPENKMKRKRFLVLEEERYSLQKSLSDLSFSDPKCHEGDPEELVHQVRTWFYELGNKKLKSPSNIWDDYNVFYSDLYDKKFKEGFREKDVERLPVPEFLDEIELWFEIKKGTK
ncbi:MAG: hypothetical protein JJ895_03560 [Balneolaceae bacterium]|nr:hypothetical protein [Balneolaceae bacterium]